MTGGAATLLTGVVIEVVVAVAGVAVSTGVCGVALGSEVGGGGDGALVVATGVGAWTEAAGTTGAAVGVGSVDGGTIAVVAMLAAAEVVVVVGGERRCGDRFGDGWRRRGGERRTVSVDNLRGERLR